MVIPRFFGPRRKRPAGKAAGHLGAGGDEAPAERHESDLSLDARQGCPGAVVKPAAEPEMLVVPAIRIEPVRVREACRVTARGREEQDYWRSRRDRHPRHVDGTQRLAGAKVDGGS